MNFKHQPRPKDHRTKLSDHFFMRYIPRGIGQRLFHSGAEPFFVARLRFSRFLLPGGKLLVRHAFALRKKVLHKPVEITGRQLTDFFEDFSGGAAHGKIVARF